jgi:hypothetical protein
MSDQLKQVFATPDGKTFDTKAEAQDHLRRPLISAAMLKVTGKNAELADWLIEKRDTVEDAFDTGTIRRVSKSDKNKLQKAVDAIVESANPKFAFVIENAAAVVETFRWPAVKRMDEAEKAAAAKASLVAATENEEVADWILANRAEILEAYQAGVVKREVNPKAQEALAEYRAKKAAEKAAAEAPAKD